MFHQFGNFQGDENFKRINFYTDIDTIDIMKKQLHVINDFFMRNFIENKKLPIWFFVNNYDAIINRIIYNLKNPLTFQSSKSISNLMSLKDRFLLTKKDSEIYKIYKEGIQNSDIFVFMRSKFGFTVGGFGTREYFLL